MKGLTDQAGTIILVLIGIYILWQCIQGFVLSPLRDIPGPSLARVTTLRAIRNRLPRRVVQAALADFASYGDMYVSRPDTITISHPRDVRAVLGAKDSWKIDVYHGLDDPVLKNLVTLSHPQAAAQKRRQISPFLNHNAYLAEMEAVILEHGAQSLVAKWDAALAESPRGRIEINYRNDTQLATFNIMSALAFGRKLSGQADSSVIVAWIAATAVYIGVSINFRALLRFPLSLAIAPWLSRYRDFVEFGKESVRLRREAISSGALSKDQAPKDMLQAFINAQDPDSKVSMSSQEVQAESVGMQLAGSETTSASLTWALHLFTLHPSALQRATSEVRGQFDGKTDLLRYADCRALPFLESFVYETFRYAPITSGFMPRSLPKAIELQGHYIPAGTKIAFNLLALNNRKDIWDDPEQFIPDRFMGNEERKRNVFAFSYGPRSCIGRNLAWMEIMTILANMLLRYDLELPEDSVYGPKNVDDKGIPRLMESQCHIVFAPVHPERDCRLRLSKRNEMNIGVAR
uniref:Cytochrome P450 n=1 Tax=Waltergamsia fusidioides TaxID=749674 RepID=A0A411G455_9HYPO|nr:cytochrome P450 [Waltergamsia fusidioides]